MYVCVCARVTVVYVCCFWGEVTELDEAVTGSQTHTLHTLHTHTHTHTHTLDRNLVIISFIVYVIIAILFLSRFSWVRTRTSLAVGAIGVIALGLMSGWG